jgi:hypothetical protein
MRTTLVIEDDVLEVARDIARAQQRTVGEVISTPARRGLRPGSRIARRLDDLEFADPAMPWASVTTRRQVTDARLVAIARRHAGRLVTFDRRLRGQGGDDGTVDVLPTAGLTPLILRAGPPGRGGPPGGPGARCAGRAAPRRP